MTFLRSVPGRMASASATNGRCVESKKRIAKTCFDSIDARVKEVSLNHSTLSTKKLGSAQGHRGK